MRVIKEKHLGMTPKIDGLHYVKDADCTDMKEGFCFCFSKDGVEKQCQRYRMPPTGTRVCCER